MRKGIVTRRQFAVLTGASFVGGLSFSPKLARANEFSWAGDDELPGALASTADIDQILIELENQRSYISLANNDTLAADCARVTEGAQLAVTKSVEALELQLNEANAGALVSTVGAVISGISAGLLFVSSIPVWLVVASGALVTGAIVPFAFSLGSASKSGNVGDGVVVASSFFSGRLSLIASVSSVSSSAKLTGRIFGGFAAGVDTILTIRDWSKVADIKEKLERLELESRGLEVEAEKLQSNLAVCREVRIQQIEESIKGVTYLRELTSIPRSNSNSGAMIIP